MSDLDDFISSFSGYTESYWFYNHTVELKFEPKSHTYFLVTSNGLIAQDGVSSIVKVIDKSEPLMNWSVKMMAQKILATINQECYMTGIHVTLPYDTFEHLVLSSKMAHKDKLEDASAIGKIAHAWIETYIKACIANDLGRKAYLFENLPGEYQAANCCEAAVDWMSWHNVRWIHTEKKVYSLEYGFAGTLDGICMADSCDDESCCREQFKDRLTLIDWKTSNQLNIEYLLQSAAYQIAYMEEHKEVIEDRWIIRLGKEDGAFELWHVTRVTDDFLAFKHALDLTRTLRVIEGRIKERNNEIRAAKRQEKKEATQKALTLECYGHKRYKGKRRPVCNNGNPCQSCIQTYEFIHGKTV